MDFNNTPPTPIKNLFGNWLDGTVKQEKENIRVGVCDLLWDI
jgi:hypothetical protein